MKKTYVMYTNEEHWKTVKKTLKKEGAKLRYRFKLNLICGPIFILDTTYCVLYSCDSKTNGRIIKAFGMEQHNPVIAKEL